MPLNLKLEVSTLALAAISTLGATAANAQDAAAPVETVTVTGTSIRGVAPIGSNLITVGQVEAQQIAPITISELLADVPAITGMGSNGRGMNGNGGPGSSVYIHQLGESADNATLVLMDGHRIPSEGAGPTDNATVDPNIIPLNMLERVDVLADGSSATYGSDAIAGVVNFITRKSYDGIQFHYQAQVEHGAAMGSNGDILIGKSWSGGSVMASYDYQYEGSISDTSFWKTNPLVQPQLAAAAGLTGTSGASTSIGNFLCSPAAVQPGGAGNIYLNAQGTANVANKVVNAPCSQWAYYDLVPEEKTQHAMIKFVESLAPNLTFKADILGTDQQVQQQVGSGTLQATAYGAGPQANPFYVNPPGVTATKQTIYYDLDQLIGPTRAHSENEAFLADADLVWDVDSNWSVDLLASAGTDIDNVGTTYLFPNGVSGSLALLALNGSNATNGAIPAGTATSTSYANTQSTINNLPLTVANALDVWDPVATNKTSAATLALLRNPANNNNLNLGTNSYEQFRTIVNGTLFTLPGGPLKVALGAELYNTQRSDKTVVPANAGPSTSSSAYSTFDYHRSANSVFFEADIPIVGPDMNIPLMQKFELDAAVRTDAYSDVGRTTNPKVSWNWDVMDGLRVRASWSTSFVAADLSHEVPPGQVIGTVKSGSIGVIPVQNFPAVTQLGIPGCTAASVTCDTSTLQGLSSNALNKNLYPMKGHGYTIGIDYSPSFLPGFTSKLSWWHGSITGGPTAARAQIDALNPLLNNRIQLYPGCASQSQIATTTLGAPITTALPACVSFILLGQTTNLLNFWASGIDADLQYAFDTDFGAFTVSDQLSQGLTFLAGYGVPQLTGVPPAYLRSEINNTNGLQPAAPNIGTQMRAHIDWELDAFSASFAVNFTGSYKNVSSTATTAVTENQYFVYGGQGGDTVKANVTFDLHLGYNFQTEYFGEDRLSMTVRNLFNNWPPFYNGGSAVSGNTPYAYGYDAYVASPLGRIVELGITAKY